MDLVPIVNSLLKSDTCGSFHAVVCEATGVSHSNEKLKQIFFTLPKHIQMIAIQWGLSDTVFGDEAYIFIKEKVNGQNEKSNDSSIGL